MTGLTAAQIAGHVTTDSRHMWGARLSHYGLLAGSWVLGPRQPSQMLLALVGTAVSSALGALVRGQWSADLDGDADGRPVGVVFSRPGATCVVPVEMTQRVVRIGSEVIGLAAPDCGVRILHCVAASAGEFFADASPPGLCREA
jgi:hypothetical protein